MDSKGKDPKGKRSRRKRIQWKDGYRWEDSKGKDTKGKGTKGKGRKGESDSENGDGMGEEAAESNQKRKWHMQSLFPDGDTVAELVTDENRGERQYRDYNNPWGAWQYRYGAWRETRNPTDAEIDVIAGSSQTVDFGERADKTYEAVRAKKPQYAVYPINEDQRNHLGPKKFITRTKRQKIEKA